VDGQKLSVVVGIVFVVILMFSSSVRNGCGIL
jgi:hypothetical protein